MPKKVVLSFILSILTHMIFSQVQTPVYLSQANTNANVKGFYRYLPADYATSTKNYPLIIWAHGAGQTGQGNVADLPRVLEWGLPKIISDGGFPTSFTVGGSSFSIIILDRIYLVGISAGGGAVWDYASTSAANSNKLAAIIPFCGTLSPTQSLANRIAGSNLPVWAFHNTNDGTVPVANSRNRKNYMNSFVPAPNPAAKLTEFSTTSSDQFELTVTDNFGAISKDTVTINVYVSLPTGAQQRVLIDVGGTANYEGIITASPNINGNAWNNMTDAHPGIRVSNAQTINNQPSGLSIEIINRVDGTYSTSTLGINGEKLRVRPLT